MISDSDNIAEKTTKLKRREEHKENMLAIPLPALAEPGVYLLAAK